VPLELQVAVDEIVLLEAAQAFPDLPRSHGTDPVDRLEIAVARPDDRVQRAEVPYDVTDDRIG
jgi:hypothetical protein